MSVAEYLSVRLGDRDVFHGGPYGSQTPRGGSVGIEASNGLLYCVGCHWCDPDYGRWLSYAQRELALPEVAE